MGANSYNNWESLDAQIKKQLPSTNYVTGFTHGLNQLQPATSTLSTLGMGWNPDTTSSNVSSYKPTFQMQIPDGVSGNNTYVLNQGGKTMADYYGEASGIGGLTNGQLSTGINIANTALNAVQLGLGAYYNQKNYKLQKQALNLQKQDLAYNQKVQYNKALSSANIVAGMGRGVEGFNADANTAAVKAAYAPTINA